ncbi:hypothetical protein ACN28S_44000 [Cystobacter fuscus]
MASSRGAARTKTRGPARRAMPTGRPKRKPPRCPAQLTPGIRLSTATCASQKMMPRRNSRVAVTSMAPP